MPFENYSDEVKLDVFADGLTEDLTAALSKAPELFVISRSSSATYKGKPIDMKKVAEEQGIQYVLEGSVQKADDKLRITVQLVDALNGRHLWADRFDRQAKDIFALHLVGRKAESVASYKKAIALKPNHVHPHAFLTAVYADLGRIGEAKTVAKEVMRLDPKFTVTRFIQSHTLHDPARDARFKDLLQRAGLPE